MTSIEWLEKNIRLDMNSFELIKYFDQAKEMHKTEQETLYTEEQVREAYIHAFMLEADEWEREHAIKSANYFIQSLKQHKQ
jgi:hypothetical protein